MRVLLRVLFSLLGAGVPFVPGISRGFTRAPSAVRVRVRAQSAWSCAVVPGQGAVTGTGGLGASLRSAGPLEKVSSGGSGAPGHCTNPFNPRAVFEEP